MDRVRIRTASTAACAACAAALLAASAWPSAASAGTTIEIRYMAISTIVALAAVAWLMYRRLGAPRDGMLGWGLAMWSFAAVVCTVLALLRDLRFLAPSFGGGQHVTAAGLIAAFVAWTIILLVLTGYLAGTLGATAGGSRALRSTLRTGLGFGAVLGLAVFAAVVVWLNRHSPEPWLGGTAAGPPITFACVLVLAGPAAAALMAGAAVPAASRPAEVSDQRIRQSLTAGWLTASTGGLLACALSSLTIAALPASSELARTLLGTQVRPGVIIRLTIVSTLIEVLILVVLAVAGLAAGSMAGLSAWGGQTTAPAPNGHVPR